MDKIKEMVHEAIPLDPKCEVERTKQIQRRAKLRLQIEEIIADLKRVTPFDPRNQFKTTDNV